MAALPGCRYQAESQEQRILFRGTFATQRPGGAARNALDVYVKNTSNTNVTCWGGRLWSLFEAGQPYRLNPHTLETEVRQPGMHARHVCLRVPLCWAERGSLHANTHTHAASTLPGPRACVPAVLPA